MKCEVEMGEYVLELLRERDVDIVEMVIGGIVSQLDEQKKDVRAFPKQERYEDKKLELIRRLVERTCKLLTQLDYEDELITVDRVFHERVNKIMTGSRWPNGLDRIGG